MSDMMIFPEVWNIYVNRITQESQWCVNCGNFTLLAQTPACMRCNIMIHCGRLVDFF